MSDVQALVQTPPPDSAGVRWTRSEDPFGPGPVELERLFDDEVAAAFLRRVRQTGFVGGWQASFAGRVSRAGPPDFGAGVLGVYGLVFRGTDGARVALEAVRDAERTQAQSARTPPTPMSELDAKGLGEEGHRYRGDLEEDGLFPWPHELSYTWRRGNVVLYVYLVGVEEFLAAIDLRRIADQLDERTAER